MELRDQKRKISSNLEEMNRQETFFSFSNLLNIFMVFMVIMIPSKIVLGQTNYEYSPQFLSKIDDQLRSRENIKKNGSLKELILINNQICFSYLNLSGEFEKAIPFAEESDSLTKFIDDERIKAIVFHIHGRILSKQGFFESAIHRHSQALEIRRRINDSLIIANSTQQIGKVFREQRKFTESIPFLKESLKIKKKHKQGSFHTILGQIASSYYQIDSLDQAKIYLNEAIKNVSNPPKRAFYGLHILKGEISYKEGRFYEALDEFQIANDGLKKTGGGIGEIINSELCLAKAYNSINESDRAKVICNNGLIKAKEYGYQFYESIGHELLSQIYIKEGKFQDAIKQLEMFNRITGDLFKQQEILANLDFNNKWQLDRKESTIQNLIRENEIQKQTIAYNRKIKGLLIIVFLLTITIGIAYLYFKRYSSKTNKDFEKIKSRQREKENRNRVLTAALEGQENERRRIAKELHDGLGGMLGTASMHLQNGNFNEKRIQKLISDSCEELRRISRNMMPVSLEVLGFEAAVKDLVNQAEEMGFSVVYETSGLPIDNKDLEISIYRIIQELMNNIFKHSNAENIILQIFNNEGVYIIIEDDGIGFYSGKLSGQGISNIRSRIEVWEGHINIDSKENEGTLVNIYIPQL